MWLWKVNSGKVQYLIISGNCNVFHKLKTKCLSNQSQPSAVAYTNQPITLKTTVVNQSQVQLSAQ